MWAPPCTFGGTWSCPRLPLSWSWTTPACILRLVLNLPSGQNTVPGVPTRLHGHSPDSSGWSPHGAPQGPEVMSPRSDAPTTLQPLPSRQTWLSWTFLGKARVTSPGSRQGGVQASLWPPLSWEPSLHSPQVGGLPGGHTACSGQGHCHPRLPGWPLLPHCPQERPLHPLQNPG